MATQKVTPFPSLAQAPALPGQTISQAEITLLLSLRNRLRQLAKQVEDAETDMQARLGAGVGVEPGEHTAQVEVHWRKSVAWKAVVVRLADRLGLNGDAYCANVLSNTKPTPTVSLFLA